MSCLNPVRVEECPEPLEKTDQETGRRRVGKEAELTGTG